MPTFVDMMGESLHLDSAPQRIISLVPSQTELLFSLGLGERVVGVTKYCIHPKKEVRRKAKVGGTKDFELEKIAALQPDLIIGNKEENEKKGIEALKNAGFPVWMSDIYTLADALTMISEIGKITDTAQKAETLRLSLQTGFEALKKETAGKPKSALYLIWREPWMAAGPETFIHEMLPYAGFKNAVKASRYPVLSEEELKTLQPQEVLLSSEPYPFKEKHFRELQEVFPAAKIRLVDGEMFSWYGSRLQLALNYFKNEF
jgi:ABC-type Fe3+-hydroxamate transport system substrate-binding protein